MTEFVASLVCRIGLEWEVPDFSTPSRHQETPAVNIPYRGAQGLLHLLIDSTGIKVEGRASGTPASMVARLIAKSVMHILSHPSNKSIDNKSELAGVAISARHDHGAINCGLKKLR